MDIKKIIYKIIFLAIILFAYSAIEMVVNPIVANYMATYQMDMTQDSNMWIQLYSYVSNYSFVFGIILIALLFRKEVIELYKKLKGENKNEEKN